MAFSWDAGIELVSPMPDRESFFTEILQQRGEGLMNVVFAVGDVEKAREAAESLGLGIWYSVDYDQETIDKHLRGRFTKYKLYMLDAGMSGSVQSGAISPSPNLFKSEDRQADLTH